RDRVQMWMTLNEPMVSFVCGYFAGEHAPGRKFSFKAFKVPHNLLLAHGYAVQQIRSIDPSLKVGIVNAIPFTDPLTPKDRKAALKDEGFGPFLFMDPIYKGHYPKQVEKFFHFFNRDIRPDDFNIISQPTDFLGINHYSRDIVKNSLFPIPGFSPVRPSYEGVEFTDVGWEVYPQGMYEVLTRVHRDYAPKAIFITENGAAFPDTVVNGKVKDERRVNYLKNYCAMVKKAIDAGVPVKGYFAWSLLDNFEWAHGYSKRFGVVHVDFETQKRTIKDSGLWYRDTIEKNGFVL
ncbi:MAG: glycoside hydrolase family 1 protein, partial [Spirochaetota bacterium]